MKKLAILMILGTIILSLPSISIGSNPIRIMPLGDSITYGTTDPNSNGYRGPLYYSLVGAGYNFDFVGIVSAGNFPDTDNEGHPGWHADDSETENDILGQVCNWLTVNPADIILLHIGTNDIAWGDQDANEISYILDKIDNFDPDIKVVVALIIDMNPHNPTVSQFNIDVNSIIQNRIAAGDNLIVVDMESALTYPDDLADWAHPNLVGYSKMADVWFDTLDNMFSKVPIFSSYRLCRCRRN